jgi:hypothetical protein
MGRRIMKLMRSLLTSPAFVISLPYLAMAADLPDGYTLVGSLDAMEINCERVAHIDRSNQHLGCLRWQRVYPRHDGGGHEDEGGGQNRCEWLPPDEISEGLRRSHHRF